MSGVLSKGSELYELFWIAPKLLSVKWSGVVKICVISCDCESKKDEHFSHWILFVRGKNEDSCGTTALDEGFCIIEIEVIGLLFLYFVLSSSTSLRRSSPLIGIVGEEVRGWIVLRSGSSPNRSFSLVEENNLAFLELAGSIKLFSRRRIIEAMCVRFTSFDHRAAKISAIWLNVISLHYGMTITINGCLNTRQ